MSLIPRKCDREVTRAFQAIWARVGDKDFHNFTASRLVATDSNKKFTSVSDLTSWITGTTNQITVTDDTDGTVTLSAPQDIATSSSPTFSGLTLSGLTASRLVATDGSKGLSSSDLVNWVTGTVNQVTITDDSDGTITLSLPQDIDTSAVPTFGGASFTGSVEITGADVYLYLNNGADLRFFNATDAYFVGFEAPASLSGTTQWVLPDADGSNGDALVTDGAGNLSWDAVSAVAGNDTEIQYNDGGILAGDSNLIWVKSTPYLQVGGDIRIQSQNGLLLRDADNSHYTRLKAHATTTTSETYILPATDGSSGELLSTDGAGNLSWSTGSDTYKLKVDVGATGDYLGAAYNDGVLRVATGISYTDGGDYVTLGYDINSLTALGTLPAQTTDYLLIYDADAGTHKKITPQHLGYTYVDRGDPATNDWDEGDLTTDGTWRDLDLSSVVPANAKLVHLKAVVRDGDVTSVLYFRLNGNSNAQNSNAIYVQNTSWYNSQDVFVACDANRVIEYWATNTTWTRILITIRGWFI